MNTTKTVFIDRDGVINQNRPDHVKNWSEFEFIPNAIQGLVELSQAGFRLIVVTNQAVINRGIVPRETVESINKQMMEMVRRHGGQITASLYCPHRPEENCSCRKPAPGLLFQAQQQLGAQLHGDYLIGDHLHDLQAGWQAGCRGGLVLTGRGYDSWLAMPEIYKNDLPIWSNLLEAARWIIAHEKKLTAIAS